MRTDDDSWSITESVGSTALFVALCRALEARREQPLVLDRFAAPFCRAAGGRWADLIELADSGAAGVQSVQAQLFPVPQVGAPFVDFQAARTRFFDQALIAAATAGVRQVVILAAGLDSRAWRLPWPAGTRVFELDQPRVLEFKQDATASDETLARALSEAAAADRVPVAVDLRDDWPAALRAAGFDADLPAVWLLEGLLIYLPATAQERLFTDIDRLSAPGSRIAVEDAAPMSEEYYRAQRAEEIDRGDEGTFYTLIYNERHAAADAWLADHGWSAEATSLSAYLAEIGRPVGSPEAGAMTDLISLTAAVKG